MKSSRSCVNEKPTQDEITFCNHQIARFLFYNWKNKLDRQGTEGLAPGYHRSDPKVKALKKENERPRKVISTQALELEVKEEL